jgi:hypothetical protein
VSSRQQRDRDSREAQQEVRYGPQHYISKQTERALEEHIKPLSGGRSIRQLISKIPGVAAGDRRARDAD